MAESTWSFSQKFTSEFQDLRSELESQVKTAKQSGSLPLVLQELATSLAKITKALADATGSIPSYDQKLYESQLKALELSIENLREPESKPKFSFKRKLATTSSTPAPSASSTAPVAPPAVAATVPQTDVSLSGFSSRYLTQSSLGNHKLQTDLALSDLNDCVIDLLPLGSDKHAGADSLRLTALHARNLKKCLLILPVLDGSALLHDLTHCTIILGSHQFRMHTSSDVDVLLDIESNPIIEDCQRIRFGCYPRDWVASSTIERTLYNVQDFSHIRSSPSPNFSFLPADEEKSIIERITLARRSSDTDDKVETSLLVPPC